MQQAVTKTKNQPIREPLRVYLLGRFELKQGTRLIDSEDWRSGKARSLFKILVSRPGFQISRQEACELLWPEMEPKRSANNLHQALYNLRRTLEPDLEHATESVYLKTEGNKLLLNTTLVEWVDLQEFISICQQVRQSKELALYEKAAELYRGDYLPEDMYEDWSVWRRETLRQEWLELLTGMAELYKAQGQVEQYLQCLHKILEYNFSHEPVVQSLMLTLAELGRVGEALGFYRSFALKLQKRLNIEPLAETKRLYQELSAGRVGVRPASRGESVTAESSEVYTGPVAPAANEPGYSSVHLPVDVSPDQLKEAPAEAFALHNSEPLPVVTETPGFTVLATLEDAFAPLALPGPNSVSNKASEHQEAGTAQAENSGPVTTPWQEALAELTRPRRAPLANNPAYNRRLVGRVYEQQLWQQQLQNSLNGENSLLWLCGEAGAGKTHLARTLGEQAQRAGFTLLFVTATPAQSDLPLGAAALLVEQALRMLNPNQIAECLRQSQTSLFQFIPSLVHLNSSETSGDSEATLQAIFVAAASVLSKLARQHPVAIVIDDLHNLGGQALRLVRYLLSHPNIQPVVALGTVRPGLNAADPTELNNLLRMNSQTRRLARFSPAEVHSLVVNALNAPVGPALLDRVNDQTEGNPGLTLKLLAAWNEQGGLQLTTEGWALNERWENSLSESLKSYILQQIEVLSQPAQVLISLAALLGQRFSFASLRQIVWYRPDGGGWWIDMDKTNLGPALQELIKAGLVEEQEQYCSFAYPLLRQALVSNLSYNQRLCWQEVIRWAQTPPVDNSNVFTYAGSSI